MSVLFVGMMAIVRANPVSIQDASFDVRALSAGSWNTTLTPWQETGGPGNSNGFIERVSGFSADGLNHLGMNLNHNVWQDLGITYQPHTRYTLTVAVGNRGGNHTQAGNQSQYLLAASDGTIQATGTFNASTIAVGTFSDAPALVFETGSASNAIGKTVRIRLQARGAGRSHFDRIRLTAVPTLLPQTITFSELPPMTEGDAPVSLTASASSGLPVSYSSSNPAIASISGNLLTAHAEGMVTISASQQGNTTYLPATPVLRTLTVYRVGRDPQTIDFPPLPVQTAGNRAFTVTATASSGLPVVFSSGNPAVAVVAGNTVTISGPGSAVITASQAGDANHLPAPAVQQTLVVNPSSGGLAFDQSPLAITLASGESADTPITLTNTTGGRIDWSLSAVDQAGRTEGLDGHLDAIMQSGSTLNGPLPLRFDFTGGTAGSSSMDVANSIGVTVVREGNRLQTNLGGPLNYTASVVANSNVLGPQGRYFTRKLPGLFMFGADTDGISWFEVNGSTSYGNAKQNSRLRVRHNGRWWNAFVVSHQDYWSTVNQMILVDQDGLDLSLGNLNSHQMRISGLSGKRRIYHFLYLTTSNAFQPPQVFEDLARRFLGLMPDLGSRLSFDPIDGSSPASGSDGAVVTFDARGMPPGTYQGNVLARNSSGGVITSNPLNVTVTGPRVQVPSPVERLMFPGQVPETIDLQIISNLPEPQPWTAEVSPGLGSWLRVETVSGNTAEPLRLRIDPVGMVAGTYDAVVTILSGPATFELPVRLRISELAISKFVADPAKARVYAIHKNGLAEGALLVFDSVTRRLLKAVPTGKEPTDCDVSEDGSRVWVINSKDPSLTAVDTATWQVQETIPLTGSFSVRSRDAAEPGAHVKCGKGSIIYYVDEQWGPRLRVFDTATRTLLQTFSAETGTSPDTSNNFGYGDIGLNGQKTRLYGWRQYGDSAGVTGSHIVRFDIEADGRLKNFAKSGSYSTTNFDRSPYDTPVLVSTDGTRLAIKDREVNPENLDSFPRIYPAPLYSLSGNGRIAATESKIHSTTNAGELISLPVSTRIQAILPDLSALVYFNSTTRTTGWIDLVTTLGGEVLGLPVSPGDRAVVTGPSRLEWPDFTGIERYRVYLGTSETEVKAGTPGAAVDLGETSNTWIELPAALGAGRYFWRVVPVGPDGQPLNQGMTFSFTVAPLALSRNVIQASTVAGNPNHLETLSLTAPEPVAWSATASVPWIRLSSTSGTSPADLGAVFDASSLAAGSHSGEIRITSSGSTTVVPVTLSLYAPNFTLARADLESPRIYAVSEGSDANQPAFLMAIDTATDKFVAAVPAGNSVTSMSVHQAEDRIYLTNWKTGLLRAFDRSTLEEVRVYSFDAPPPQYTTGSGVTHTVAAGREGRVALEQQNQSISLVLLDTASGSKTNTSSPSIQPGGGVFEPGGRYYYHGDNGNSNAMLQKFDTQTGNFVRVGNQRVASYSYYGSSRVGISGDGTRVFWNGGVFDQDLNVLMQFGEEIVASTHRGEILFTSTKAFNGRSSGVLATLPVNSGLQAVSADQKKLYQFDKTNFRVVDISTIANVSPRGLVPGIEDKSVVVGTTQELSWLPDAPAPSYDVFFGTSETAVAAATRNSPEFLGTVNGTRWTGSLTGLAPGGTYFWRVDVNDTPAAVTGAVWSFRIAPLEVNPRSIALAVPAGMPLPRQELAMSSPAPLSWTAASSTPWITVTTPSGTSPGTLRFDISTTGMTVGPKTGSITIQSSGGTFSIPVDLSIISLNVTRLVAHPQRPVVYAIHTATAGEGYSHLLELDAATASIRRTLPVGFAPTDADLDAASGRLYVANFGYNQTRVIDVDAWRELPGLNLGTDIYRLEITPGGNLITEGDDQITDLRMWNTTSGALLATDWTVGAGDGQADPTGRFFYHGNSSYSESLARYDISSNTLDKITLGPTVNGPQGDMILSSDGSRLFWQGQVLDGDMNPLARMPNQVHATNRSGDLAVGASAIWWSDSGTVLTNLPFSGTVAAFSSNDSHLLRFNATTRTLHSTAVASLTDLPGPRPRPGQVLKDSPDRLTWSPVPGATSYRVYLAADASTLQAMSAPTATVSTPEHFLGAPLDFGRYHYWRIDAVTGSGSITGTVSSFGIEYPAGPAVAAASSSSDGVAASLGDRHLLVGMNGSTQLYEFDPATGSSAPLQSSTLPGYYGDHYFGASVAMDSGKAAVGAYAQNSAYLFRPGASGYWESRGSLNPPAPVSGEGFGFGLAASGNLMLAGTLGSYSTIGRVCAYVTEPGEFLTQTFSASDGVVNDGFGRAIVMEGNLAVISSPGNGASYNRLSALYAFSRSTSTGLWSQTQKIPIAGATTSDQSGKALAMSGNTLATTNGAGTVVIYTRNVSGQWVQSATIPRTSVANSSTSFGSSLALVGDQLFVGDPHTLVLGKIMGSVFSFRRSGTSWIAAPVIVPATETGGFGSALAVRDHWLAVAAGSSQPARLFRVGSTQNRTPRFASTIPHQVVAGREFSIPVRAEDADGSGTLVIDKLQGPAWLSVTDGGNGEATMTGTPTAAAGTVHTVQIRVRDANGAQALHTMRLSVLSASEVPVFTQVPGGQTELGVGQELALSAAASGTGPFEWQWYLDGKPIPGATRDRFFIGEVSPADAGRYHVRVRNAVAEVNSEPVTVTVRPASRFAGDWPTFGGSPSHTGRHPAALDSCWFVPAWSQQLQPGQRLNRAAIAGGRAVIVPRGSFANGLAVKAVALDSGDLLWQFPLPSSFSTNPPSIHDGRVYFQRGKGTAGGDSPQLFCLDAATGSRLWASNFGAQWESYEAPAVTDAGIFVNGGTYGGMYGFNFDGSQRFFTTLAQVDGWTPTIHQGRLYSFTSGSFTEHNPNDGSAGWTIKGLSGTGVPAVHGDSAVVRGGELGCFDLTKRALRWKVAGSFGQPAIANGSAFSTEGNMVRSFSLADGKPGPIYQTDATVPVLADQPILFNDRLAISNETTTWIFDLQSARLLQKLDGGGRLSYANGYLLAAGEDGTLRAFLAKPHGRAAISAPDESPLADNGPALRLGSPPVGGSSITTLTITNSGLANLGGMSWIFTGGHAGDFTITKAPPVALEPGAEATIEIKHTPSAKGRRDAVLVLTSNDPSQPKFRIPLFAQPPSAGTLSVADITGVGATLHGQVIASGNDVTIAFEYGTTNTYGTTVTADPAKLGGSEYSMVAAAIAGLPPGTRHHFRLGATNAHGTHWSNEMTFTTLSDNARLSDIVSSLSNRLPAFDPEIHHYLATVDFSQSELAMRPVTEHPGATLTVNGIPVPAGTFSPPLPLAVGNNPLTVLVTAEDRVTKLSYTTVVTRLPEFLDIADGAPPVSARGFSAKGRNARLRLGFHPPVGASLTVIDNTSLLPIYDEFENLSHGQRVTLDFNGVAYDFVANYFGGTGNDLVLHWADTFAAAWGQNTQGQLGDGTTTNRTAPVAVEVPEGVLTGKTLFAMSAGYVHSLALLHDGTMAAWGHNTQGQLGLGHLDPAHLPRQVTATGALAGKSVVAIASGAYHNLALCSDGTVVAWGHNNHGQLGTGDRLPRTAPAVVPATGALAGKRVTAVAAGSYHSLALCDDGTVAAWGYNDEGELGDGTTQSALIPVALDASGVLAGKQVAHIAAGQYHSLALCTDGTLVSWGFNGRGQLGDGTITDRHAPVTVSLPEELAVQSILNLAAGGSHSLIRFTDGTLAGWGDNGRGQLDADLPSRQSTPAAISGSASQLQAGAVHTTAMRADGSLDTWGDQRLALAAAVPESLHAASRWVAAATGPAAFHHLVIAALPRQVGAPEAALVEWREVHFGENAGSNLAADCGDCDHDGVPNLVEFAFGMDPNIPDAGRLPQARITDKHLEIRFMRPPGVSGITYGAEWSDTLMPGSWRDVPNTGTDPECVFSVPLDGGPRKFLRLKTSSP